MVDATPWSRQPRWPRRTPTPPTGPGAGRWKDDGKPNLPHPDSWAEAVAKGLVHPRSGGHHSGLPTADEMARARRGEGLSRGHGPDHRLRRRDEEPAGQRFPAAPRKAAKKAAPAAPPPDWAEQTSSRVAKKAPAAKRAPAKATRPRAPRPTARDRRVAQIASGLHEDWRREYAAASNAEGVPNRRPDGSIAPRPKKTTDQAWIDAHGTDQVDIANTGYHDLPSDWQQENRDAAAVVHDILQREGGAVDLNHEPTRRRLGHEIHREWLARENNSYARGGALDVPFVDLPADEQDKDINQLRIGMAATAPPAAMDVPQPFQPTLPAISVPQRFDPVNDWAGRASRQMARAPLGDGNSGDWADEMVAGLNLPDTDRESTSYIQSLTAAARSSGAILDQLGIPHSDERQQAIAAYISPMNPFDQWSEADPDYVAYQWLANVDLSPEHLAGFRRAVVDYGQQHGVSMRYTLEYIDSLQ